ncbi:hypothetical protein WJX73_009956 [Symbiochloris irregularis]|uniref:Nucleotide-diphospho-sugar transferase domain-containing protein n=1 Tax=Symbiochloris irregularis TaxID=706552 RepID=A0AAW1NK02_9CHLO
MRGRHPVRWRNICVLSTVGLGLLCGIVALHGRQVQRSFDHTSNAARTLTGREQLTGRHAASIRATDQLLVKADTSATVKMSTLARRFALSPEQAQQNAQRLQAAREMQIPMELLYQGPVDPSASNASLLAYLTTQVASAVGAQEQDPQDAGTSAQEGLPPLSRQVLRDIIADGTVFLTLVDTEMLDWAFNWVEHLVEWGMTNLLVGAMDAACGRALKAAGVPGFDVAASRLPVMPPGSTVALEGSNMAGQQKVAALMALMSFNLDVVYSEADVTWMRDPTEYLEQYEDVEVLVASDALRSSLQGGEDGLELATHLLQQPGTLSTSIVVLRHRPQTLELLSLWMQRLVSNPDTEDGAALESILSRAVIGNSTADASARVLGSHHGSATLGVLPISLFANGHTYFVQRLFEKQETEMEDFHLMAMSSQLNQVRQGMAMALVLQRTLIMPPLTCFCDRHWLRLDKCRAPGAAEFELPFTCPMDHVMEVAHLEEQPELHGPPIAIREHDFLRNSRVPMRIKTDSHRLLVPSHVPSLFPGDMSLETRRHAMPMNPSDRQLRSMLTPLEHFQVLAVRDVQHAFGGFEGLEDARIFAKRLQHIPAKC